MHDLEEMKTLISRSEKYERRNKKRNADRRNENGLTSREQAKMDLIAEIKAMKEQGFTQKEVAEKVKKRTFNSNYYKY